MRRKIAAGNWKMNTRLQDGLSLVNAILEGGRPDDAQIIFGVPATHLANIQNAVTNYWNVSCAAQNCHQEESGAYTGEISASMITAIGVDYVILGHSERRDYFGENDALIAKKVKTALMNGLTPIYCCGEKLPTREAGDHIDLVGKQIEEALFGLSETDFRKIIIAYEPVWAIGTGVTASPEQAQEMHLNIRQMIAVAFGQSVANDTSILYGGSVKGNNAQELFAQPDVDGGLIGGASLNAAEFLKIVNSF
jgi:triosephosphate isomerase